MKKIKLIIKINLCNNKYKKNYQNLIKKNVYFKIMKNNI